MTTITTAITLPLMSNMIMIIKITRIACNNDNRYNMMNKDNEHTENNEINEDNVDNDNHSDSDNYDNNDTNDNDDTDSRETSFSRNLTRLLIILFGIGLKPMIFRLQFFRDTYSWGDISYHSANQNLNLNDSSGRCV